jgi:hypothetical protein
MINFLLIKERNVMLNIYFKKSGNDIIFIGEKMEILIPNYFFDSKYSVVYGNIIKTFGVLPVRIYDKNNRVRTEVLSLPTNIYLYLYDMTVENVEPIPEVDSMDMHVLKYTKNDKIMKGTIDVDSGIAEVFLGMLIGGKLPPYIPYKKLLDLWIKNFKYTKTNLNVPTSVMGVIISGIYRDKKNNDIKYVESLNKNPNLSPYAYNAIRIRDVCAHDSVFSALTFEDMDTMITTSLNMSKQNKKQNISPIEKIVKM